MNVRRLGALAVLVALLAGVPQVPAGAARRSTSSLSASKARKAGVDASIQAISGQLDEVDANEAALQSQLDAATARQADLAGQLRSLDARLATVQVSLDDSQRALDRASAALVSTQLELARVRARQQQARDRLRNDAVEAYVNQPAAGLATALLDLRSVDQLQAEMGYLSAVASAHSADVARYQQLKTRTQQLEAQQQQIQSDALSRRDAVAGQRAAVASARAAVVSAQSAQSAVQASLVEVRSQLAQARARLVGELAALQAQSDQIAALILAEEQGGGGGAFTGGRLSEPIPGAPITSPYGWRVDPVLHQSMMHTGIDFGAPFGTPIHAAADGVVVAAGPEGGYGNATVIDHGGSIATLYGHQEQILVAVGQHVSRGDVIGLVGCTGWCTGPHVHFEVRVSGRPVDPAPYLGLS